MRIISFIDQPDVIKKILEHLGLWEKPLRRGCSGQTHAHRIEAPRKGSLLFSYCRSQQSRYLARHFRQAEAAPQALTRLQSAAAHANASGTSSSAYGANSIASGNSSIALGASAEASAANSVALGAGSIADQANTVSVGSAGIQRRITNVAPGRSSGPASAFH